MEIEIMNNLETFPQGVISKRFRALKSRELVSVGDFVLNENKELEMWEGPSGFQADSFVRQIYRREAGGDIREQGKK